MEQTNVPKPPYTHRRIKIIATLLGLAIISIFFWAYIFSGSFNGCEYTEKTLPIPPELQSAKIVVEDNIFLVKSNKPGYCTQGFKNIYNDIVTPEWKENFSSYEIGQGKTYASLNKGKEFSINKIVQLTKHGLSTIDSGPGPYTFLILTDDAGIKYSLFTLNFEDINYPYTKFFSYGSIASTKQYLNKDMFK